MTTVAEHDIETIPLAGGMVTARCRTHDTQTATRWRSRDEAHSRYYCDRDGLRFIAEFPAGSVDAEPSVLDLSGLAKMVHGDAESRTCGDPDMVHRYWQWRAGGALEPLTATPTHFTGFNDNDYGTEFWQVTGEDGRVILAIPVRIDGRN